MLEAASTQDLIAELRRRLVTAPKGGWRCTGDPAEWPDWYIAKGALHDPNAPQELIDLKRFSLCLRRLAPDLSRAIETRRVT